MYYVVEFHADGGQMCVDGRRVFTDPVEASRFAAQRRAEPGHFCGPESVREYATDVRPDEEGYIYPMVANQGRELFRIQQEKRLISLARKDDPAIIRLFRSFRDLFRKGQE